MGRDVADLRDYMVSVGMSRQMHCQLIFYKNVYICSLGAEDPLACELYTEAGRQKHRNHAHDPIYVDPEGEGDF